MAKVNPYLKHKRKWGDCEDCELCNGRRNMVFSRGILPCQVLFVGEAPGPSENLFGVPFIGPAGKLLDSWLRDMGFLDPENEQLVKHAFTNLVCCMPTDEYGNKEGQPGVKHIKACSSRLVEFVRLAKPKSVVCVGKLCSKRLPLILEDVYVGKYYHIVHPAAIMRLSGERVASRSLLVERNLVTLRDVLEELPRTTKIRIHR